jgi:hypoxanthine phosphoribosyltransferase
VAEAWPSVSAGLVSLQATTERTHDNTTSFPQRQQIVDHDLRSEQSVRFAHPAEAVVADLLSSFGVRWLYEPVTFPLVTSETGRPVQCFTPDFYLPDHDVYIEMTTMRQSLVTRKNRKFRLMREIYPHVNVRLLYRKDVELIVERYTRGRDRTDLLPGPILATADQIGHKAAEVAARLECGREPVTLIALGEGAVRFRDRIAEAFTNVGGQADNALVQVKRSRRTSSVCEAEICLTSADDLRDSRRILVADVVSTGLTVNAAATWFRSAGIPIEGVVALLDRRSARLIDVPLLVPGIPAPSSWMVGAGLGGGHWSRRSDVHSLVQPSRFEDAAKS